jgi:16S rRNA (cytidine1402-2'-O)-methyltransferase
MPKGALYVVATPIGNLEDMSPRAVRTLQEADVIAAEDTRHSRRLLTHFAIQTPLTSYHEHNEQSKTLELIELLECGKSIALISDAGTPCISDPGYRLVRAARAAGHIVFGIPGPAAALTALSVSGLPSDRFTFHGFFPRKASERQQALEGIAATGGTHIFYESPQRVLALLARIEDTLPDAQVSVARELTKKFETTVTGSPKEVRDALADKDVRGECVVIIYSSAALAGSKIPPDDDTLRLRVEETMATEGLSRRDAVRTVAERLNLPRNAVYAAAAKHHESD